MSLFDAYLAIDWSARNKPSSEAPTKDALWVGEATSYGDQITSCECHYERTRHSCIDYVRTRLQHYAAKSMRVFVGFDFAYGYPNGFAAALGFSGNGSSWRYTLDEISGAIQDDDKNSNDRFKVAAELNRRCNGLTAGPLWGCPVAKIDLPYLNSTSPSFPFVTISGVSLDRLRLTDRRLKGVQPVWKLFYTGSVGGQVLVGLPQLRKLRDNPDLAPFSRVWPFETSFSAASIPASGPLILHAEIWPGVVKDRLKPGKIHDCAQVEAMVEWLAELDSTGKLAPLFEPPVGLSTAELQNCIDEEGWILGAGWNGHST